MKELTLQHEADQKERQLLADSLKEQISQDGSERETLASENNSLRKETYSLRDRINALEEEVVNLKQVELEGEDGQDPVLSKEEKKILGIQYTMQELPQEGESPQGSYAVEERIEETPKSNTDKLVDEPFQNYQEGEEEEGLDEQLTEQEQERVSILELEQRIVHFGEEIQDLEKALNESHDEKEVLEIKNEELLRRIANLKSDMSDAKVSKESAMSKYRSFKSEIKLLKE